MQLIAWSIRLWCWYIFRICGWVAASCVKSRLSLIEGILLKFFIQKVIFIYINALMFKIFKFVFTHLMATRASHCRIKHDYFLVFQIDFINWFIKKCDILLAFFYSLF